MILEHALLQVPDGRQAAFEAAFATAQQLIAAAPGFLSLELLHCLEQDNKYLLLVRWQSVAAHEQGFRSSPDYQEWKALLHHFYDPFPLVQHYRTILTSTPDQTGQTPDPDQYR